MGGCPSFYFYQILMKKNIKPLYGHGCHFLLPTVSSRKFTLIIRQNALMQISLHTLKKLLTSKKNRRVVLSCLFCLCTFAGPLLVFTFFFFYKLYIFEAPTIWSTKKGQYFPIPFLLNIIFKKFDHDPLIPQTRGSSKLIQK